MKTAFGVVVAATICLSAAAEQPAEPTVIRGRLVGDAGASHAADEPILLKAADGRLWELVVEGDRRHTLHDEDLAGREWEFEGRPASADRFEVREMFTVKDGKRHKVSYYCEICHITSYRPGRCMCCQEKVDLRETPEEP